MPDQYGNPKPAEALKWAPRRPANGMIPLVSTVNPKQVTAP